MLQDKPQMRGMGLAPSRFQNLMARFGGNHPDYWLMAIVAILLVLGLVMVYSASFVTAEVGNNNAAYYLWRHLMWLGVGSVGALCTTLIDYHILRRFSTLGMAVVLALLLAILVLPKELAPTKYGAKRWITPFGAGEGNELGFQPSELAKVMLILYAAHWLSSKGDKVRNIYYGLIPFALTLGVLIGLIMGQPDLGTSLVIGCIGMGMFFIAGANIFHMLVGLATSVAAFYVFAVTASYRLNRFTAYTDPFSDPTGVTYHSSGNIIALASGGIFGSGLGASRQKFLWLPNVFTDSIFAVIGEELGMVGACLVVLLFVALAWRGMRVAAHAPDDFGRLIAAGVTIYVVMQALINIGVICNLIPFTGIPLPLISYGGTSLAVTMAALGLLLNVSRQQVSDPRLLMAEEVRTEQRRKRELLREQRQADRERREANRKLVEAEQVEEDRQQLAKATRHWYDQREKTQVAEVWQTRSRQQAETQRQATQAARFEPEEQNDFDQDLPPVARQSYLSFQNRTRLEKVELDDGENYPPKLRKPRRDWAKVYEARRNRKN